MYAVRNIRLCTKDCLCLYVCPTGATDTETGQIDPDKCLEGCRLCVDACPSHAISLVPRKFPEQQKKSDVVKKTMGILSKSKLSQENIGRQLAKTANSPSMKQLMIAIEKSNRVISEDILREAGFMLPQSSEVLEFLKVLLESKQSEDFPTDTINKLIQITKKNKAI